MTILRRIASPTPILSVESLDGYLADEQERAIRDGRDFSAGNQAAAAARHGMATDLRALIADWLAETREDATRQHHQDEWQKLRDQGLSEPELRLMGGDR